MPCALPGSVSIRDQFRDQDATGRSGTDGHGCDVGGVASTKNGDWGDESDCMGQGSPCSYPQVGGSSPAPAANASAVEPQIIGLHVYPCGPVICPPTSTGSLRAPQGSHAARQDRFTENNH